MKVLVVDDDGQERDRVVAMIARTGFDALAAGTGESAHTVALRERPDMAVIKTVLPDMRGMQLFYRIRIDPELRKMTVMLANPNPDPPDEEVFEGFRLCSDFQWTYPLDVDQLGRLFDRLDLSARPEGRRFQDWDFTKVKPPAARHEGR